VPSGCLLGQRYHLDGYSAAGIAFFIPTNSHTATVNLTRIRFFAVFLVLSGAAILALRAQKNVTLIVDGQTIARSTFASTVSELLQEAQITLDESETVTPALETRLRDGQTVWVGARPAVTIYADGQVTRFYPTMRRPRNMLAEAGISLFPRDVLRLNGEIVEAGTVLEYVDDIVLTVERAKRVYLTVHDGAISQERTWQTTAPTLGEALTEADLLLAANDELIPPPDSPITMNMRAQLTRALLITIETENDTLTVRSPAQTVGDALQSAGISLQGLDYSIPEAAAPIPVDESIRVVRVTEQVELEQETIPFSTQYQPNPEAELDTQQILQIGSFGIAARRVRVRYEDGVEVGRMVEAEWTAANPTPRIVGYGTKIVVRTVDTPDGPIEYWRSLDVLATSYSPCRLGIPDYCNNITASGQAVRYGLAAMSRTWFNAMRGRSVYVPGYGSAEIADIGGGGNRWIDLAYLDDDWVSWYRNVTIYFMTPAPPEDQILWTLP